jgi:hypothetical protein
MTRFAHLTLLAALLALSGCTSFYRDHKNEEAALKQLQVIPGKVSFYVCREKAFAGARVNTEPFVNGRSIGRALKSNTFAQTELDPGKISVFLRRDGQNMDSGDSGTLELEGKAGEVLIVWAGPAGAVIAPLTIDRFESQADGEACVRGAAYAVK